jgi:thioredoxin
LLSESAAETELKEKEKDAMEIKLTNDNFKETVMNSEKPVLIDFWAAWCGPCRMIAPIIEEIAEERKDILVCKVNVDEEEALAAQFGISSIPTIVVMKNGKITAKAAGYRPKPELLQLLEMGGS